MDRKVFWRGGNGQKSVLAWEESQEKCYGMAGMDRKGALGHPWQERLSVPDWSIRPAWLEC